jgi:mono/diheme cytochrome c family protein
MFVDARSRFAVAGRLAFAVPFAVAAIVAAATSPARGASNPATDYLQHCAGCHQVDGSGLPRSGVPSFVDNVGHFLRSPQGRAFLVQVPGTAQSPLSDARVAALLNWMLDRFSAAQVPRDAAPYSAAEVAGLRGNAPRDLRGARREIVEALASQGFQVR